MKTVARWRNASALEKTNLDSRTGNTPVHSLENSGGGGRNTTRHARLRNDPPVIIKSCIPSTPVSIHFSLISTLEPGNQEFSNKLPRIISWIVIISHNLWHPKYGKSGINRWRKYTNSWYFKFITLWKFQTSFLLGTMSETKNPLALTITQHRFIVDNRSVFIVL